MRASRPNLFALLFSASCVLSAACGGSAPASETQSDAGDGAPPGNGEAGSSDATPANPNDTGTSPGDAGTSANDGGGGPLDATDEASSLDASAPPSPLASGSNLILWGVTSDGFVIYSTNSTKNMGGAAEVDTAYYAVSVSGGPPIPILEATCPPSFTPHVSIQHTTVFLESNVFVNTSTFTSWSPITVWSKANGAHALTSAGLPRSERASADGSHVLYADGAGSNVQDGGSSSYDLYVATADGSGKKLLVPRSSFGAGNNAQWMFAGPNILVGTAASVVNWNGFYALTAYAAPSWTASALSASAIVDDIDATGAHALVVTLGSQSETLEVVPVAGGPATMIDSIDPAQGSIGVGAGEAMFTHDGKRVIYFKGEELLTSPILAPSAVNLGTSPDHQEILNLAPDDATALIEDFVGGSSPARLFLGSTTECCGGEVSTAEATDLTEPSGFTADSSFAFFVSATGALQVSSATSADAGATQITPSATVWANSLYGSVSPTSGARIVFTANPATPSAAVGSPFSAYAFELKSQDLAGSAAPVTIASSIVQIGEAPGAFYLTPAGDHVVYAGPTTGSTDLSVYAAALP